MKHLFSAPLRFTRAMYHAMVYKFAGHPFIAPQVIQRHRESVCGKCLHHRGGFCGLCSCYVKLKVQLATSSCPDTPPRWDAVSTEPPPQEDWDEV